MYGVDWITPPKSPPTSVAEPLGGDDLAGRIVVAGRRGALGAVDPADDRRQGQRDRHRQEARPPRATNVSNQAKPRRRWAAAGPPASAADGPVPLRPQPRPEAERVHAVVDQAADHDGRQGPRELPRELPARRQRGQDDGQGREPRDRLGGDVEQRQEADDHQGDRRQRAEQPRAGDDPPDPGR